MTHSPVLLGGRQAASGIAVLGTVMPPDRSLPIRANRAPDEQRARQMPCVELAKFRVRGLNVNRRYGKTDGPAAEVALPVVTTSMIVPFAARPLLLSRGVYAEKEEPCASTSAAVPHGGPIKGRTVEDQIAVGETAPA
jgi:hypothetical protein